ncbi:unnamed protein product [Tilletia laevis]|nr:hypothetical protein CF336_g4540 [Tilletia laevis]CAD6893361.1 unnamed protein product [Tilletia caries]CAD6907153.1 unnamed protein product [Tilletia laevis]CAD6927698.1 unnamed protein product [Tilletia controversa]
MATKAAGSTRFAPRQPVPSWRKTSGGAAISRQPVPSWKRTSGGAASPGQPVPSWRKKSGGEAFPRQPAPPSWRKTSGGEALTVADHAKLRRDPLPRHASSVQRDIWDQQIEISTKLKRLADRVMAAEAKIKVGGRIGTEEWNKFTSDKRSEALLGFEKAEYIAKISPPEAVRSVVIYNQRIRLAFLAGKRGEAIRLYNLMKKSNLYPTALTLSIMFSGLNSLARRKSFELGLARDKQFTEQVASLAHDVLQLHVHASKLWVTPKDRRLSPNQLAEAQKEHAEAVQLINMSSAALAEATPAMRMAASRQKAAAELEENFTTLSRAYSSYIILLSRTTKGRPAMVWQVYEALRRGVGRPEGISEFDFARPFRSKTIFTTMLTGVFLQVSTPTRRQETRRAVQRAALSRQALTGATQEVDQQTSATNNDNENDSDDAMAQEAPELPSTPFGQARQLWLDWEDTIEEAEQRGINRSDWQELEVDEKALDLFLDFFSKCREEKERVFAKYIKESHITRKLRK